MLDIDGNKYHQDPLRQVDTNSGTILTVEDICFDELVRGSDKVPSQIKLDVLKRMREVSLSVKNLSDNPDFKNLLWYLGKIRSTASRYAFNPTLDAASKAVWYSQLNIVMTLFAILYDFKVNDATVYQEMIDLHLEEINASFEDELQGEE